MAPVSLPQASWSFATYACPLSAAAVSPPRRRAATPSPVLLAFGCVAGPLLDSDPVVGSWCDTSQATALPLAVVTAAEEGPAPRACTASPVASVSACVLSVHDGPLS